ncbi:protein of unknown function [Bartonella clarridgeiae 73]|uniref:Uncharacterized protein n=1 Tax=Bartonella clarridgeiae (strain CCUG 45776 / CIP 104772 / 73) TaxID=696125 RepID=E6YGP1_BARC7|nr:protein of unknown function [Bartonella clarridgeiae 73]
MYFAFSISQRLLFTLEKMIPYIVFLYHIAIFPYFVFRFL